MKANGVIHLQIQSASNIKNTHAHTEYVGFTTELKTCATIEEGLRSFDKKNKVKLYAE